MPTVFTYSTPNNIKVPLALEEAGLAYDLRRINVRAGEQKTPEFQALNPNGKVPVLVDSHGPDGELVLTETAAILVYIAGDSLSIADIAHRGWLWRASIVGIDLATRPNLSRWYAELAVRPAFAAADPSCQGIPTLGGPRSAP